jgi:hypothetical protein
MSFEVQPSIQGPVGAGVVSSSKDARTVQRLINVARTRMGQRPIAVDGDAGNQTSGAIRDFQVKSFGQNFADGRVDVNGRTFRRLKEINSEPALVSPKTYVRGPNGRYSATVGIDGRILVRAGDWLSKYSAAINGDYYHVKDFGRVVDGALRPVENPNLIRAGEVLYHIPTYRAYVKGDSKDAPPEPPPTPTPVKQAISRGAMKQDFKLKGDYGLNVLDSIGTALDYSGPFIDVLSWAVPLLEAASTAVSLVALPFSTYGMLKDWANAGDTDLRFYGMRAAIYATTAWAYGDSIPDRSPEVRANYVQQPVTPERLRKLDEVWRDSATAAVHAQEQFAASMQQQGAANTSAAQRKAVWQSVIRALAGEDGNKADKGRATVSIELMKELGNQALSGNVKLMKMWEYGYRTPYPR